MRLPQPRLALVSAVLSALSFSPALAQIAGCDDDFGSNMAKWTSFNSTSVTGSAVVSGGTLQITGQGKDVFGAVNEYVAAYRTDIAGDFDVSVKIDSQTNSNGWAQAGILAANGINDLTQ